MRARGRAQALVSSLSLFKCGRFLAWFSLDEALFVSDGSETERKTYNCGTNPNNPWKSCLGLHCLPQGATAPQALPLQGTYKDFSLPLVSDT